MKIISQGHELDIDIYSNKRGEWRISVLRVNGLKVSSQAGLILIKGSEIKARRKAKTYDYSKFVAYAVKHYGLNKVTKTKERLTRLRGSKNK